MKDIWKAFSSESSRQGHPEIDRSAPIIHKLARRAMFSQAHNTIALVNVLKNNDVNYPSLHMRESNKLGIDNFKIKIKNYAKNWIKCV